jgi:hypothetical protein
MRRRWRTGCSSGDLLLVSAAYNNGARLLKVTQAAGKTTVQELWYQNLNP